MTKARVLALGAVLCLSVVLAFFLRDAVYDAIILPLSYVAWQLVALYRAIPQLVKWILVTAFVAVAILWQLIPQIEPSRHERSLERPKPSALDVLADEIRRARSSNYLRWQIANRLGRLARRLVALEGWVEGEVTSSREVEAYLSAGVDRSFADFPPSRSIFSTRRADELDLDPRLAVEYLESRWGLESRPRDQSL